MTAVTRAVAMLLAASVLLAGAASAQAAGCEVLDDVRDRSECVARQQARDAARAEVARQIDAGAASAQPGRSAAWQNAVDEAGDFDAGAIVQPRLIAAVGGLLWFVLAVRRRRRRGRAAR